MKFFWPIYFLTAVVGTLGVYVGAPLARPYVEGVFGKREGTLRQAVSQEGAQANVDAPSLPAVVEPAPLRPATPDVIDDGGEFPPAMNGIYMASSGDKPLWGITFQRTSYYGLDGARLGHVPGGVLLDYKSSRVSSIGNMVECVLLENGTPSAPRLVSRKDVYLFTGSYAKLSAKQRADLLAYYALSGKIGDRRNELLQESAAKNPYFSTYNQAYKVYMAHIDAAKELTAKRDKAVGLEKSRLEDTLREMKVAETALRQEYDDIHGKFRLWKNQHAKEITKAENDPDVAKWTQEMSVLRSSIPGLAM